MKEREQFHVGRVYRNGYGHVFLLQRSEFAGEALGYMPDCGDYFDLNFILADGSVPPCDERANLLPGELHLVDGSWVEKEAEPEKSDAKKFNPTNQFLEAEYVKAFDPNAAMIARDETHAARLYAEHRAFISKVTQTVADRKASESSAHPPLNGLTRLSVQDHRFGTWK